MRGTDARAPYSRDSDPRTIGDDGLAQVRGLYLPLKQALDRVGAGVALVALSPVYLLITFAIALESGFPVLYCPTGLGRGGREFRLFKFRTMVRDAAEVLRQDPGLRDEYERTLKIKNDPRITRVGRILRKTSLDEIPQLANVLRGEMSLVGPRVLSHVEYHRYGAHGPRILSVAPGVTGLWQVNGRHTVSFERRVELDLEYIARRTLVLDIWILLKTIPAVLSGRGAG